MLGMCKPRNQYNIYNAENNKRVGHLFSCFDEPSSIRICCRSSHGSVLRERAVHVTVCGQFRPSGIFLADCIESAEVGTNAEAHWLGQPAWGD